MKIKLSSVLCFALMLGLLSGCGKKADTSKSVDQIKSETQTMSVNDLQSNAEAYAKEITLKKSEVEKIANQMKSLSPQELFGDKSKGFKDQLSKIQNDLSALTDRYQIYAQKFQEKGGDISKIKI